MSHNHATIPFFPMQPNPEDLGKTYNLLRGLGREVNIGFAEHTFDIIQSAIRGRFNVDQGDNFNHAAYEHAAKKNNVISRSKKVKKEVKIMEDSESSEEGSIAYGYVKASSAIALEGVYEATEGLVALPDLVEELKKRREHIEVEHRVDVIVALRGAIKGDEGCQDVLRELNKACENTRQLLEDLLYSVVEARRANLGELDFDEYLTHKGL